MALLSIEDRIERLLDQLENSGLSTTDIEKIQQKIAFLRDQQE